VGSRGLGAAASFVMGSVSTYVLHHLAAAALVVHDEPVAA
jgi:nucleotide-binding universal stress UspA family protein